MLCLLVVACLEKRACLTPQRLRSRLTGNQQNPTEKSDRDPDMAQSRLANVSATHTRQRSFAWPESRAKNGALARALRMTISHTGLATQWPLAAAPNHNSFLHEMKVDFSAAKVESDGRQGLVRWQRSRTDLSRWNAPCFVFFSAGASFFPRKSGSQCAPIKHEQLSPARARSLGHSQPRESERRTPETNTTRTSTQSSVCEP